VLIRSRFCCTDQALYYCLRTAYLEIRSGDQHSKMMMQRRASKPSDSAEAAADPDSSSSSSGAAARRTSDDGGAADGDALKRAADRDDDGEDDDGVSVSKKQRVDNQSDDDEDPSERSKRPRRTAPTSATSPEKLHGESSSSGPRDSATDDGDASSADASASGAPVGSGGAGSGAARASTEPASDLVHVSNVMQNLRMKHTMLAGALENMIEDLVNRFKPTPEEEFLRTTHVLLSECLKYALAHMDRALHHAAHLPASFQPDIPVPQQIAVHLQRVLSTFFTARNTTMAKYRSKFEQDFGSLDTMTLDVCLRRLHDWHRHMTSLINRASPPTHTHTHTHIHIHITATNATYTSTTIATTTTPPPLIVVIVITTSSFITTTAT
jgi:hypothetical protein